MQSHAEAHVQHAEAYVDHAERYLSITSGRASSSMPMDILWGTREPGMMAGLWVESLVENWMPVLWLENGTMEEPFYLTPVSWLENGTAVDKDHLTLVPDPHKWVCVAVGNAGPGTGTNYLWAVP